VLSRSSLVQPTFSAEAVKRFPSDIIYILTAFFDETKTSLAKSFDEIFYETFTSLGKFFDEFFLMKLNTTGDIF
jgi:hypothetical protein